MNTIDETSCAADVSSDGLSTPGPCAARARAGCGFSLVELLVVVAIIALLVSILLPSLAAAKEHARMVLCLNNMRQMVISAFTYADSNARYFPPAVYYANGWADCYSWDFITLSSGGGATITPGLLWQGSTIEKIQQCPSFKGKSNTLADPYTGYNYNTSFIGHGDPNPARPGSFFPPARAEHVRSSASCAIFGDGQWASGANKYMRAPRGNPMENWQDSWRFAGTQGFRHNGKTNVAFCDGHAVSQADRYTAGLAGVAEGTGFLSPDNSLYDLE